MSPVADESTCIRLDHVGAWTLRWAKNSASTICVANPHSLSLLQGPQILCSMSTVKILTLATSLGSVTPVEVGSVRWFWKQRGHGDRKASPEAAPHEQLSRAVPGHARCVAVCQEGQRPVRRLLEEFLNRPHHTLDFPIRLRVPGTAGDVGESVALGEDAEFCRRKLRPIIADEGLWDPMPCEDTFDDGDHRCRRRRAKGQHFRVPRVVIYEEKVVGFFVMKYVHPDSLPGTARRHGRQQWLCSLDPRGSTVGTVLHHCLDLTPHGRPPDSSPGDGAATVHSEVSVMDEGEDVLPQRSGHQQASTAEEKAVTNTELGPMSPELSHAERQILFPRPPLLTVQLELRALPICSLVSSEVVEEDCKCRRDSTECFLNVQLHLVNSWSRWQLDDWVP